VSIKEILAELNKALPKTLSTALANWGGKAYLWAVIRRRRWL